MQEGFYLLIPVRPECLGMLLCVLLWESRLCPQAAVQVPGTGGIPSQGAESLPCLILYTGADRGPGSQHCVYRTNQAAGTQTHSCTGA